MAGLAGMIPQWLYVSGFDYYYTESFFWGFIAAVVGLAVEKFPRVGPMLPLMCRAMIAVVAVALLTWHGRCWVRHKLMQDYVSAYCELYEAATREGLLKTDEIGTAPFGYVGWRLEPSYTASGGTDPGAFNQLLQGWDGNDGIGVIAEYPKPIKNYREWLPSKNNAALRAQPSSTLLKEIKAPVLWFYTARFQLKKVPIETPRLQPIHIDPSQKGYHPFPINDEEWRELLLHGSVTIPQATVKLPSP